MDERSPTPARDTGTWARSGALFGMVAGVAMLLYLVFSAEVRGLGLWTPFRRIAGIVLGASALEPGAYGVGLIVAVGLVLHLLWSAVFGAIFGALAVRVGPFRGDHVVLSLGATLYGALLWMLNYYIIGPGLFPWFSQTAPVVQFVAHAFFYGTVLGILLGYRVHVPSAVEV